MCEKKVLYTSDAIRLIYIRKNTKPLIDQSIIDKNN